MSKKLSPREKAVQNAKNYDKYVAELEISGRKFPINQFGEVNKGAIAFICGFHRQVLNANNNPKMANRLAADVARIGLVGMSDVLVDELADEPAQESGGVLSKKLKKITEQVGKLKKELALKDATVAALKAQIVALENDNTRLKHHSEEQRNNFDFLITTGRRFTL